jgi:hypothetical protein
MEKEVKMYSLCTITTSCSKTAAKATRKKAKAVVFDVGGIEWSFVHYKVEDVKWSSGKKKVYN